MFILYLAKSMDSHLLDHTYSKPKHLSTPEPPFLLEHDYYMNKEKNISMNEDLYSKRKEKPWSNLIAEHMHYDYPKTRPQKWYQE